MSVTFYLFYLQDVISAEFIHRLKSLLQRAYHLQEEFEGVLCMSDQSSNDSQGESGLTWCKAIQWLYGAYYAILMKTIPVRCWFSSFQDYVIIPWKTKMNVFWLFTFSDVIADMLIHEELDDGCLRDSVSIASTDSFVSAAEVREVLTVTL